MGLHVVILAAGAGKRMNSTIPKVLHKLAGTSLLEHVVNTSHALKPEGVHIIYGHCGDVVRGALGFLDVNWIEQKERLGTGHAVMQALPFIDADEQVLVLSGDVPLISIETLTNLLESTPKGGVGILTAEFDDPTGLGRIVRDSSSNVGGIVEHRDANEKELQINEIYSGIMTAPAKLFNEWLPRLKNDNAQNEYYLTELIHVAVHEKLPVIAVIASQSREVEGVNDRFQLADLERYYQSKMAHRVTLAGASLRDPARFDVRGHLEVSHDVIIDINVVIEGDVVIGANSYIGPNTVLRNVRVGENVNIDANCVIEDAILDEGCQVGPFARIRPGTHIAKNAKVGNFVEIKNSDIGEGSKVSHLSYIGDASLGRDVNIGAGTITCNYDGANKHRTVIGDNAFIGSNTELVAPIRIGDDATVGAGSTLRKDAPAGKLTINTSTQKVIDKWVRPSKKKMVETEES